MDPADRLIINVAMTKMFTGSHLSICDIDKCLKLAGIPQGGKTYQRLHALHCVHFADMPDELRNALPNMVNEVLGTKPVKFELGVMQPPPVVLHTLPAAKKAEPPVYEHAPSNVTPIKRLLSHFGVN